MTSQYAGRDSSLACQALHCLHHLLNYQVRQNKVYRCFLSNRLEFTFQTLQIYFLKCSTSNCQVKYESVEKRRSYRLFNITAYRFL